MFNLFGRWRIKQAMRTFIGHSEDDARQQVDYPLFDFHVQSLDDTQGVGEGLLLHAATISKTHSELFGIRVVSEAAEDDLFDTAIKLHELQGVLMRIGSDYNLMPVMWDRNIFGFLPSVTMMPD